jgi:AcrR family transcriptional regulator
VHTVGIDRIIERAGVAKASLYSAFGSKDELVRAYLQGRHEARQARILSGLERFENPRDRLLGVFDVLAELTATPGFRGCAFYNASAESPAGSVRRAGLRRQPRVAPRPVGRAGPRRRRARTPRHWPPSSSSCTTARRSAHAWIAARRRRDRPYDGGPRCWTPPPHNDALHTLDLVRSGIERLRDPGGGRERLRFDQLRLQLGLVGDQVATPPLAGWVAARLPGSSDASAPTTDMPMASQNTITRPSWNGPAISRGKNSRPVRLAAFAGGSAPSTRGPQQLGDRV